MGSFGGYSPFGMQLGGGGHESVENSYASIRANLGDAFDTTTGAVNVYDDIAAARLMAYADACVDRYLAEQDPRNLTSMLPRWEQILGIVAPESNSEGERRQRVSSRMLSYQSGDQSGIGYLVETVFAPWKTNVTFTELSGVTQLWPGDGINPTEWYSDMMQVTISYTKPDFAPDSAATKKVDMAYATLDDHLPAYCTFIVTAAT